MILCIHCYGEHCHSDKRKDFLHNCNCLKLLVIISCLFSIYAANIEIIYETSKFFNDFV